jgi:N-methylhydantoinase B/oxoprolinase/acetone carboxylase alpha subunit
MHLTSNILSSHHTPQLVEGGVFQEEGVTALLNAPGALPGNYGTRCIGDNIADLKAQVAANVKGAALMGELVREYGLPVVRAYMSHIQDCAEAAVREMLRKFSKDHGEIKRSNNTAPLALSFLALCSKCRVPYSVIRARHTTTPKYCLSALLDCVII